MSTVIDRLLQAVNQHDLEDLVSCFADDYVNETPVHPLRGFTGTDQVRANWTQIFGGVRDLVAVVLDRAENDDRVWSEWEMSGTRSEDGGRFLMRGVLIFVVRGAVISSARFYLEPVEVSSGDVNAHTQRVVTGKEST